MTSSARTNLVRHIIDQEIGVRAAGQSQEGGGIAGWLRIDASAEESEAAGAAVSSGPLSAAEASPQESRPVQTTAYCNEKG